MSDLGANRKQDKRMIQRGKRRNKKKVLSNFLMDSKDAERYLAENKQKKYTAEP